MRYVSSTIGKTRALPLIDILCLIDFFSYYRYDEVKILYHSDGVIPPEILRPKLVVAVKRLRVKFIEEITAGIWRCDTCGKTEKSLLTLDLHFDTCCERLSPIECDVCPAVIRDYRDFVAHFMEHQMGETRRCPICLCENIWDMKEHLIVKGHFSSNLSELDLQGNESQIDIQNSSTSGCSNSFESETQTKGLINQKIYSNSHVYSKQQRKLEKHNKICAGKNIYKCDVCKKCFSKPSSLNEHQGVHTGEKPFQCVVCKKCFSQSSSLNKHQRVHTGEKPFQCNVCEKCFSLLGHLKTHQRMHTGEKPFQCNVCGKTFFTSSHLKRHQRMHTGEKPFQCGVCNKFFSRSCSLNLHQTVHTGEKLF